jgi:hypothetical protein
MAICLSVTSRNLDHRDTLARDVDASSGRGEQDGPLASLEPQIGAAVADVRYMPPIIQ